MRVDQVVVPRGRMGGDPHHPGGEGAQLPGQVLLVTGPRRGRPATCRTTTPGSTSTTAGWEALVVGG